ncbi:substrate-binding domain-containing protein [Duganella radicis]|uniref:Substrate-binding domain-containing protein n=1 Tax=Duganella radicis TaxID=551988 RepID=A0A6L6PG40_9BURK|nr:substrate-binding domain-containing protein [Duganella radicis]MTV37689.1 substrate-binding domain-containing protein [Duganella radicis]
MLFKRLTQIALLMAAPLAFADSVPATMDGQAGKYRFLEQASHRWRLCAVLPHAFDRFFWAVAYGLDRQATALGVDIGIAEAGGYDRLSEQKRQIRQCVADQADAVLIAAINPTALDDELALLARHGIKVIDLVNGLSGDAVTAHSHQNFF